MFTSSLFKFFKIEYKVVVLPLPVGPEANIIPFGEAIILYNSSISCSLAPISDIFLSSEEIAAAGTKTRITIFSFPFTGNVFKRKSYDMFLYFNENVPSCGRRCSAISIFANTLYRVIIADSTLGGNFKTSFNIPDIRNLTAYPWKRGSMCISLAPISIASHKIFVLNFATLPLESRISRSINSENDSSSPKVASSSIVFIISNVSWSLLLKYVSSNLLNSTFVIKRTVIFNPVKYTTSFNARLSFGFSIPRTRFLSSI